MNAPPGHPNLAMLAAWRARVPPWLVAAARAMGGRRPATVLTRRVRARQWPSGRLHSPRRCSRRAPCGTASPGASAPVFWQPAPSACASRRPVVLGSWAAAAFCASLQRRQKSEPLPPLRETLQCLRVLYCSRALRSPHRTLCYSRPLPSAVPVLERRHEAADRPLVCLLRAAGCARSRQPRKTHRRRLPRPLPSKSRPQVIAGRTQPCPAVSEHGWQCWFTGSSRAN